MFSETEMDIVGIDERAEIRLPAGQFDLGEDRVGIDIGQPSDLPIVLRALEHSGDVDEEVGGADHFRTLLLRQTEPL
jgi:hypothetical protein